MHKGESIAVMSNYRPISILPIIRKLLEKLMQCNHNILISKLEYYGIRGTQLNWFKSYLSNRKQCVQIGQTVSSLQTAQCGVPQGSILGPLLFHLCVNDISQSSNLVNFHLFADDTSVFCSNKDNEMMEVSLNNELHNISNWLKANKLSLNVKKSDVIHINNKRSDNSQKINLCFESEMLEVKSHAKYLGVLLGDNLNWKAQIQHVNLTISKGLGILAKLRQVVPEKTLRSLYNSFIQPHIDYGSLVWGSY